MSMKPVFKIEVYTAAGDLRDTIETDAFNIEFSQTLTDSLGQFSFFLPTRRLDGTRLFNKIAPCEIVKIYLDRGQVGDTPDFKGRIEPLLGTMTKDGKFRSIRGKDSGEILLRRLKGMDDIKNVAASTIVSQIAADLGLGTSEIETDTTEETHCIDVDTHIRYFDFLKKVSDYWYSAGTQVKKDFRVDINDKLVWKSRPFRTIEELLVLNKNILSYGVLRNPNAIANKIYVYGCRGQPNDYTYDHGTDMATPEAGDTTVDAESASAQKVLNVTATAPFSVDDDVVIYDWGDQRYEKNKVASIQAGVSLTMVNDLAHTYQIGDFVYVIPCWISGFGNVTLAAVSGANEYKIGSRAIEATAASASDCGMSYAPLLNLNLNYYPSIYFWAMSKTDKNPLYICLYDIHFNEALFYTGQPLDPDSDAWSFFKIPAGRDNENGWLLDPDFDWANVWNIAFVADDVITGELIVDGFYIGDRRFSATIQDTISQNAYTLREHSVTDNALKSDADCQRRGEALLYQMKDLVVRIDIETYGNKRIKVGDRMPLSLPDEGINNQLCDVVKWTQKLLGEEWRSFYTLLDTGNTRMIPYRDIKEYLVHQDKALKEAARGLTFVK